MKQKLMKMMGVLGVASLVMTGCGSGAQSASGEVPASEEVAVEDAQDENGQEEDASQEADGESEQTEAADEVVDEAAEDNQESSGEAALEENTTEDIASAEIQGEIPDTAEDQAAAETEELNLDEPKIDWEANDKSAQPEDWYELQEDGYVLVLKLEDPADDAYEWVLQNHYESVIEVSDETNGDGMHILTLDAALEQFGTAQIALQYTDAWDEDVQETIVMDLFVDESGGISVETAFKG